MQPSTADQHIHDMLGRYQLTPPDALGNVLETYAGLFARCQDDSARLATLYSRIQSTPALAGFATQLEAIMPLPVIIPWHPLPDDPHTADPARHDDMVLSCAITADWRWLVSASADSTLKVWDIQNGGLHHILKGHSDYVLTCRASHQEDWIVSTSLDNTLRVWQAGNGAEVMRLAGRSASFFEGLTACDISPDESRLVAGAIDGTIQIWDSSTQEMLHYFQAGYERITACRLMQDGQRIALATDAPTIRIQEIDAEDDFLPLKGHHGTVNACDLSVDDAWLVSASDDRTLRLWDTRTGEQLQLFEGHTNSVTDCALHPDPDQPPILSVSHDGTVRIWEIESGTCLTTLHLDNRLYSATWSADGEHVLIGGERGVYFLRVIW